MKLIAAVDENWGIGCHGRQLTDIPEDKKRFRELTMGGVVVMGRKTQESLPSGLALDGRTNIVLTRDSSYKKRGFHAVHSIDELISCLENYQDKEIFVIGGGSVYSQLLDKCEEAYITKVCYSYAADIYCPDLDDSPEWELVEESEEKTCFDMEYTFVVYRRKV